MNLVLFLLVLFFVYPLISVLLDKTYVRHSDKAMAFLVVLLTSWAGWIWLWCQKK